MLSHLGMAVHRLGYAGQDRNGHSVPHLGMSHTVYMCTALFVIVYQFTFGDGLLLSLGLALNVYGLPYLSDIGK